MYLFYPFSHAMCESSGQDELIPRHVDQEFRSQETYQHPEAFTSCHAGNRGGQGSPGSIASVFLSLGDVEVQASPYTQ